MTVPRPGGSDKKRSVSYNLLVAGTTSAGELDDLRRHGLHSSDLLKLIGQVVPDYVDTWTQGHIACTGFVASVGLSTQV